MEYMKIRNRIVLPTLNYISEHGNGMGYSRKEHVKQRWVTWEEHANQQGQAQDKMCIKVVTHCIVYIANMQDSDPQDTKYITYTTKNVYNFDHWLQATEMKAKHYRC